MGAVWLPLMALPDSSCPLVQCTMLLSRYDPCMRCGCWLPLRHVSSMAGKLFGPCHDEHL